MARRREHDRVALSDDPYETVQLARERRVALAIDENPYVREVMSGRAVSRRVRVDVATGKRDKILTKSAFGATLSPSGRYALYQQDGQWWSLDLTTGARANLTGKIKSAFVNMEDDHPVPERRAYGVGRIHDGREVRDRLRSVRSLAGERRRIEPDAAHARQRRFDGLSLRE